MFTLVAPISNNASGLTIYVALPVTCRLIRADNVVSTTAVTTTGTVLTLSDGTTTIGTVTIAASSAVGTIDHLVYDTTSLGAVELGPEIPLKIVDAGTAGAGAGVLTLTFDEFHSDI